jgi:hypothetical protein
MFTIEGCLVQQRTQRVVMCAGPQDHAVEGGGDARSGRNALGTIFL